MMHPAANVLHSRHLAGSYRIRICRNLHHNFTLPTSPTESLSHDFVTPGKLGPPAKSRLLLVNSSSITGALDVRCQLNSSYGTGPHEATPGSSSKRGLAALLLLLDLQQLQPPSTFRASAQLPAPWVLAQLHSNNRHQPHKICMHTSKVARGICCSRCLQRPAAAPHG